MIRIGLIGAGKIGGPVAQALTTRLADRFVLAGVLTRASDPDAFFDASPDLIIEAAGARAVGSWGARALASAELWVCSAAALAEATLADDLLATAARSGTSLRVLPGAIAGLDAVRTASVDPAMQLLLTICLAPGQGARETLFSGSVSEGARRFPDDVNVAVAAALAGHGPARTRLEVVRPAAGEPRELRMSVRSAFGDFDTVARPRVVPPEGIHTVAANIVATLDAHRQALRVG